MSFIESVKGIFISIGSFILTPQCQSVGTLLSFTQIMFIWNLAPTFMMSWLPSSATSRSNLTLHVSTLRQKDYIWWWGGKNESPLRDRLNVRCFTSLMFWNQNNQLASGAGPLTNHGSGTNHNTLRRRVTPQCVESILSIMFYSFAGPTMFLSLWDGIIVECCHVELTVFTYLVPIYSNVLCPVVSCVLCVFSLQTACLRFVPWVGTRLRNSSGKPNKPNMRRTRLLMWFCSRNYR